MAAAARHAPFPAEVRELAPIRIIIGEADATSRAFVVNLLREHPDVEIVAACRNGREVASAIGAHRPDVVFLSAQLPDADAFTVIDALGSTRMPPVVLIASKRDFAVRAFEVRALDYLVKPVSRRRLEQALNRAREHVVRERLFSVAGRLLTQTSPPKPRETVAERLVVRSGNRIMFIKPAEVDWVEADGNYVHLHVGAKSFRVRATMTTIESELGPRQVARIHRRVLVRLARLRELRLKPYGRCDAILENGVCLAVSRTYRPALQKRLGRP